MSDKFPGSWWKVLVLCVAIVAAKAIRVSLLLPTMPSWAASPDAAVLVPTPQDPNSPNIIVSSDIEALALVARYEDSFTPELEGRARALAEERGMSGARLSTVRSMFLIMAGNDLLLKPHALESERPEGYEVVCGDQEPDYVCLMLTTHINSVAQGYADDRKAREGRSGRPGEGRPEQLGESGPGQPPR
jgi:hypothetical protein